MFPAYEAVYPQNFYVIKQAPFCPRVAITRLHCPMQSWNFTMLDISVVLWKSNELIEP